MLEGARMGCLHSKLVEKLLKRVHCKRKCFTISIATLSNLFFSKYPIMCAYCITTCERCNGKRLGPIKDGGQSVASEQIGKTNNHQ